MGNIHLHVEDESLVCSIIAQDNYSPQLGARSILKAVTDTMRMPIVDQYLEVDEDLEDSQLETKFSIGIHAEKGIELWRRGS